MKLSRKIFFVLIGILSVIYIFYLYPKNINQTLKGIKYRLGVKTNTYIETINIRLQGKYSSNMIFGKKFKGKIYINDTVIPHERVRYIPEESDEITIQFDKYNRGEISYNYFNENSARSETYFWGDMYINSNFNKITICISEPENQQNGGVHWNSGDGLMISAPAINREGGLNISNELMKETLKYNELH